MKYLYQTSYSESYKSSLQKSLHCLFKWQRYELDKGVEWDPVITYNDSSNLSSRDPLTQSERTKLREASLNHQSIPNYRSLTPEQRDEWKAHLAQRHGKPNPRLERRTLRRRIAGSGRQ
jgi:hypothetical protein